MSGFDRGDLHVTAIESRVSLEIPHAGGNKIGGQLPLLPKQAVDTVRRVVARLPGPAQQHAPPATREHQGCAEARRTGAHDEGFIGHIYIAPTWMRANARPFLAARNGAPHPALW
jgi:hypothetical protein